MSTNTVPAAVEARLLELTTKFHTAFTTRKRPVRLDMALLDTNIPTTWSKMDPAAKTAFIAAHKVEESLATYFRVVASKLDSEMTYAKLEDVFNFVFESIPSLEPFADDVTFAPVKVTEIDEHGVERTVVQLRTYFGQPSKLSEQARETNARISAAIDALWA
jgi:hypothetical protein